MSSHTRQRGHAARWVLLLVAGGYLATPAAAQVGPALAGRTAEAANAATINSNPAGLTRLDGFQGVFDGIGALSFNKFDVGDDTEVDGGNPNNDVELAGLPLFSLSYPIGDRFRIGFGLSVPAGFGSDYGDDWAGRYAAQESNLFFVSATPVIAARVTDWLSLAVGASITYAGSDTKVAVFQGAGAEDGQMKLDVDGISAGPLVAALAEPWPGTRIGFSWTGEVKPELDGTPKFRNLRPAVEALLRAAGVLDEKIKLKMRVPQRISAGFFHEINDDLRVMGDLTWVDWSRFGKIDIKVVDTTVTARTDYDDIWVASIGADYQFAPAWRGGLGFSYVSSAVSSDDRSIGLPLDEFYIVAIGGNYQVSERLAIQTNLLTVFGGKGRVDEQTQAGRVEGKFDRRITVALQVAFVWGTPPSSTAGMPSAIH